MLTSRDTMIPYRTVTDDATKPCKTVPRADPASQSEADRGARARRRLARDEWLERGEKLYGQDMRAWKFRCVACGHVQSHELAVARKPDIGDTSSWIAFACEGRHNSKVGCDWTLGGLFQIHELEVVDGVRIVPCFEFADDPESAAPFQAPAEDPVRYYVADLAQLGRLKVKDGERARVTSTKRVWKFERAATDLVNGSTVLSGRSNRGRWLLEIGS